MKTFQDKLPSVQYTVKTKNLWKFLKYLNRWGVNTRDQDTDSEYVTVLCGGLYKVIAETKSKYEIDVITPKQFKRLVREAVGEPE